VFLIVFASVNARLEETGHLDERTFLQEIQLGASLLGAHLDVLEGTDLLLVAVLILDGGADGKRERSPCAAVGVVLNISIYCYDTCHCEIVVSCHNFLFLKGLT